jgi:hypothetical protein
MPMPDRFSHIAVQTRRLLEGAAVFEVPNDTAQVFGSLLERLAMVERPPLSKSRAEGPANLLVNLTGAADLTQHNNAPAAANKDKKQQDGSFSSDPAEDEGQSHRHRRV